MNQLARAMQYRQKVIKSPEFDIRQSHIKLIFSPSGRYIKTALPITEYPDNDHRNQLFTQALKEQASLRWREKYGTEMPNDGDMEECWAECLMASAIPYDGTASLSQNELEIVRNAEDFGDFTLDMLWLLVEGLGWRPGKPVSEDDPGWIAIWAEEQECCGYLSIIRDVLGMPEVDLAWVPPAVLNMPPDR